jgi:hypothetical protein
MVAFRPANVRVGDIAEALGLLLLQGAAAVAPVPRTADVGLDAIATLLHKFDARRLLADNSFYVQFKTSTVREIEFEGEQVNWLFQLELPLFVGSIVVAESKIELFACHSVTQAVIENRAPDKVVLHLDQQDETKAPSNCRWLNLGPAVHSWTLSDVGSADFLESTHAILKPHLDTARRNIELGRCGRFETLRWQTGQSPAMSGIRRLAGGPDDSRFLRTLNLTMPYLVACLMEFNGRGDHAMFEKLNEVVGMIVQRGATQDPVPLLFTRPHTGRGSIQGGSGAET